MHCCTVVHGKCYDGADDERRARVGDAACSMPGSFGSRLPELRIEERANRRAAKTGADDRMEWLNEVVSGNWQVTNRHFRGIPAGWDVCRRPAYHNS